MPATEGSRTHAQGIPFKRVFLSDPSQLPCDYSSTPGGTLFSTTPGGTRIIYDRTTLMHLRNSPLSRTPPTKAVPDFLIKGHSPIAKDNGPMGPPSPVKKGNQELSPVDESHEQFEIDI